MRFLTHNKVEKAASVQIRDLYYLLVDTFYMFQMWNRSANWMD